MNPAASSHPPLPSTKAQLFNRPIYRPQPPTSPKPRRRCCCCCCIPLLFLLLLAAVAAGIFYAVYRPRPPTFSISSLRLSALNLSASNHLSSQIDIAVSIRNPNRKIVYLYGPISISASSNGVSIGEGAFPAFVGDAKNATVMRGTAMSSGKIVGESAAADLRKSSVPVEIEMETRAGMKVGKMKTKKIQIRVRCGGIDIAAPKGKKVPPPFSSERSCKVKLQIKIWKWTL